MNCVQFESALPDYLDGVRSPEQQAHYDSCYACSNLVADLAMIASEARLLQALEEPSPRVWNELEFRLRQEGLIRDQQPSSRRFPLFSRWRLRWLVPVAAGLAIFAAIKLYQPARVGDTLAVEKTATSTAPTVTVSAEDREILRAVSSRPPAQLAAYKADLEAANEFIRDAERAVRDNPNDLYSRQMLINAYAEKQMLFGLVVDQNLGEQ
jgi:hypothetical protein